MSSNKCGDLTYEQLGTIEFSLDGTIDNIMNTINYMKGYKESQCKAKDVGKSDLKKCMLDTDEMIGYKKSNLVFVSDIRNSITNCIKDMRPDLHR